MEKLYNIVHIFFCCMAYLCLMLVNTHKNKYTHHLNHEFQIFTIVNHDYKILTILVFLIHLFPNVFSAVNSLKLLSSKICEE